MVPVDREPDRLSIRGLLRRKSFEDARGVFVSRPRYTRGTGLRARRSVVSCESFDRPALNDVGTIELERMNI